MNFDSGIFDILLFALIAGVLLFRLRSVLGTRNDNEPAPYQINPLMANKDVNAAPTAPSTATPMVAWATALPNFDWVVDATAHHELAALATAEPSFYPPDFIDKAKKAFAMIVTAFASNDKKTLGLLMTPNLTDEFATQIDARIAARETYSLTLHQVTRALIAGAELDGTVAQITVDFTAEQSLTHTNDQGVVMGAGDGRRQTTQDTWVFTRDLRSADPIWRLAKLLDPLG